MTATWQHVSGAVLSLDYDPQWGFRVYLKDPQGRVLHDDTFSSLFRATSQDRASAKIRSHLANYGHSDDAWEYTGDFPHPWEPQGLLHY